MSQEILTLEDALLALEYSPTKVRRDEAKEFIRKATCPISEKNTLVRASWRDETLSGGEWYEKAVDRIDMLEHTVADLTGVSHKEIYNADFVYDADSDEDIDPDAETANTLFLHPRAEYDDESLRSAPWFGHVVSGQSWHFYASERIAMLEENLAMVTGIPVDQIRKHMRIILTPSEEAAQAAAEEIAKEEAKSE